VACFKVISQNLAEHAEENHKGSFRTLGIRPEFEVGKLLRNRWYLW
jgi:hypothetical protein